MTEVTGPLLRLERDADPGDRWPHRIVRPDGTAICWATDAEAADFEARYWAGDLPRPTPPAARVLPEGVERSHGTLSALGQDVASLGPGWEWFDVISFDWASADATLDARRPKSGCLYEVRPIGAPEPEMVPHTESIGRVTTESPWPVTSYHGHADGGRWVLCDSVNADGEQNGWQNGWDRVNADPSGMVSCLPITDGDGQ